MGAAPVAFLSYSHDDDKAHNGNISQLRRLLSEHVEELTGDKFEIFQDRDSIQWGESWRERLVEGVDAVTFFLPVLSPKFFKSEFCRREVEQFLERERKLGRQDLVLPILFVPISHIQGDALVEALIARQLEDVSELRIKASTEYVWIERVVKMADRLAGRLNAHARPPAPAPQPRSAPSVPARVRPTPAISFPAVRVEPREHVVDASDPARASIAAAVAAAGSGDRIKILPGLYRESVMIDKPLELEGDGRAGDIILQGSLAPAIVFRANLGRVANLTLQQLAAPQPACALGVIAGQLSVEGCDITSAGHACVVVGQGAAPRLTQNRIHSSRGIGIGVYFNSQGQGQLEHNEIFDCDGPCVVIETGSNPILQRNQIHASRRPGVMVNLGGLGTIEDNDIYACEFGVLILNESRPTLRGNRIHHAAMSGVGVGDRSAAIIEGNQITQNALHGIEIVRQSMPTVRNNQVGGNGLTGVAIYQYAGGLVADNDLRGNQQGAWFVAPECYPMVQAANNLE